MSLYPRSFLRLILLGNVVVALPLLVAVGYAALTLDDLTQSSDTAVREASRAATLGHALQDGLGQMERVRRQYQTVLDPRLLDDLRALHGDWQRLGGEYAAIPLLTLLAPRITAIRQAEAEAFAQAEAPAVSPAQTHATFAVLDRDLQGVLEDANRVVEDEREVFHARAEMLWQRLMAGLLAALALTGLLLWLARRTVSRLWSRFERAVQALGEGRLERRIRIQGPEDMQRVGRRLEWLRRRMVALEGERTRVMRHTSHELKTPLATLREGASLLGEGIAGPLTPQQAKIADIMQANALRLQGLIDGLLRMQQANYVRDNLETSAIRLDQVIEQTLATYQLAARNRRLRIAGSLAPLTIDGGGEALATLAGNLISNAIKFSPDGGMIRIVLTRDGNDAVLDVMDHGPGIGPTDRARLFEPFYRGAAGKGVAGAGLGLAIAHELALAHRGSLTTVERERGAHFRARLPLAGTPS